MIFNYLKIKKLIRLLGNIRKYIGNKELIGIPFVLINWNVIHKMK